MKTITTLIAPCARGKTTRYAVPRMLAETGTKFLFVSPTKKLLSDTAADIIKQGGSFLEFDRIDSALPRVASRLQQQLSEDTASRITGICHASLWTLTADMVKGRTVIIDEMPNWIEFIHESNDTWADLVSAGYVDIQRGMFLVTKEGRERCKEKGFAGRLGYATREILKQIGRAPTKLVASDTAVQFLDPSVLEAADEVVLMCADVSAGYFPEWLTYHKASTKPADLAAYDIRLGQHECRNTSIFFAVDSDKFSSMSKLTGEWRETMQRLAKRGRCASDKGSLVHPDGTNHLAAVNVKAKAAFADYCGASNIISPTVRGSNDYTAKNTMIWLAALRPDPREIEHVRNLSGSSDTARTADEIMQSRHVEAIYQFVFRSALRLNEQAHVLVLVPTRRDAEALARILGTDKIEQCKPVPNTKLTKFQKAVERMQVKLAKLKP